jgi:hypothetical protein
LRACGSDPAEWPTPLRGQLPLAPQSGVPWAGTREPATLRLGRFPLNLRLMTAAIDPLRWNRGLGSFRKAIGCVAHRLRFVAPTQREFEIFENLALRDLPSHCSTTERTEHRTQHCCSTYFFMLPKWLHCRNDGTLNPVYLLKDVAGTQDGAVKLNGNDRMPAKTQMLGALFDPQREARGTT